MSQQFSLISKYRSSIMGVAALMIVAFHLHVLGMLPDWTKYLLRFSFVGVDMFLFLSGLGLCYSINKDGNLFHFYEKRFKRIFPSFIIVVLICGIGHKEEWWDILLGFSGLNYWLAPIFNLNPYFWYVSLMILLYFLFPWLYKFIEESSAMKISYFIIGLILFPYIIHFALTNSYDYALPRMLPFTLGIIAYSFRQRCKTLERDFIIISIIAFLILNVYSFFMSGQNIHKTLIQFSLLGLIGPGASCIISIILNKKPLQWLNHILTPVGHVSLELYLVHLVMLIWFKDIFTLLFSSTIVTYIIYKVTKQVSKRL